MKTSLGANKSENFFENHRILVSKDPGKGLGKVEINSVGKRATKWAGKDRSKGERKMGDVAGKGKVRDLMVNKKKQTMSKKKI